MARTFAFVAALLLAVASTSTVGMTAVGAQADVGEARYEIDPATRSVRFSETLAMPFSGSLEIEIPPEAIDLNSSASIRRESRNEFVDVVVLSSSASSASLSYTVSGDGDRDQGGTRVNESFVGFHLWPSVRADTVTVLLPKGFRANASAPGFDEVEVDSDVYQYVSESPVDAIGYWFVALKESGLSIRQIDTGEDLIELAGWAGDEEWLDFTERYVSEGVPALRELIGQPWPEEGLRVVESVAPTQFGYAGWYDRSASEIEIPDSVDSETLLHELSHAWFNDRFYQGRWMVEGFAEEYASAGLAQLDDVETEPTRPGEAPPGWKGLASWRSRFFFEDNWDEEYYGYEASWYVIDTLADEIGSEGMAATIAAMQSGEASYPQEGAARLHPPNDWRRFLDMLEIHGGSVEAESVFREWVVSAPQAAMLDARRSAIADYAVFVEEMPLPVPPGIKDSMSRWRFDQVAIKMKSARETYADMILAESRAQDMGLTVPRAIEELYVESDTDFGRVAQFLNSTNEALSAFEANPDELTEANIRNFELGRFERIDIAPSGSNNVRELNADGDSGSGIGLFLLSILCFFVLAVTLLFLLGRPRHVEVAATPSVGADMSGPPVRGTEAPPSARLPPPPMPQDASPTR